MTTEETPRESDPSRYRLRPFELPSEGVYFAVAAAKNCSPLELQPLDVAIDPDALDALFRSDRGAEALRLTFRYCGREVVVSPDEIRVCDRRAAEPEPVDD
ncbi:HalOD1 output domain-containing protein [Halegenticoccus soli]|uniref:HalOD1 output domain-containing protein n=1 Tax=Halegenticoccus soli TaxID=1985678 RepID=UPI000C6CCC2D|nr:HalOD1 output domain-containing protein [Halegenticoccus soli]